ncbi:helix-turn-helix domain-containing protein [Saccharospirillum salsuginis]|uniref:DNA-binding protein n=1 Tax=Saccharospirillum salsuginis TaxID=418750 RepID=A0A918KSZ6_9GAMM|nr:XRE family transcriptional regulator [Saccharospirillum salsuginis]GGX74854.1 DNA-binding protein [Saccharospirillum salsuginis]
MTDMANRLAGGIKALRRQRGWSLDRAAGETGVSKAMLGQIERAESSPTLNTLWKIARGYEIPFSEFLVPLTEEDAESDSALAPAGADLKVRPLVPYDGAMRAELLELTLDPGSVRESEAHEAGVVEHVILVRGRMSVLDEGAWRPLTAGGVHRFAADRPHGYRNDSGTESAVFHNLIFYPQGRK